MESTAASSDATSNKDDLPRAILLSALSVAVGALLIKTIFVPTASEPDLIEFALPKTVSIANWQMTEATPIDSQLQSSQASFFSDNRPAGNIIEAQQYSYHSNGTNNSSLLVSAYYLTGTDGDLKPFISENTSQVGTATKQDAEGNFYAVFSAHRQAHVTSCLNPRSPATVTSDQFSRNRLLYDTRLSRVLPWLQGKQTLPDERCLWTQLSVPLNEYAADAMAYEAVEAAWIDWADWWRSEF